MKFFFIIFLFFSIIIPSVNEDKKIAWNENYKLSWSDFKAASKGNGYVASTSSGISFSYTFSFTETGEIINLDVSITSYFYPENSWYVSVHDPLRNAFPACEISAMKPPQL